MIVVVATIRVKPGMGEQYEAACTEWMPRLSAANPGIVFYESGKSRDEPDTYRVVEAYRDQAAMDRHIGSELLPEAVAALQECIADMEIRLHDAIV